MTRRRPPATDAARRRRAERIVGAGLVVVTVYGVLALPLRAWLLGTSPAVLAVVTGSRPALVAVGAYAATGSGPWLWPLLGAICSIVKFHWVFWWAGRLWGEAALVRVGGDTARARRRVARAEALVRRYQLVALASTYVPIPVAREVVHVALGTARVPIRRLLAVDLGVAAVTQTACLLLGVWLGEGAVGVVKGYAVYAGWVALAALAFTLLAAWRGRGSSRVSRPSAR